MSLTFFASTVSECHISSHMDFLTLSPIPPADKVLKICVDLNTIFKDCALPYNKTDVGDNTPEQTQILVTDQEQQKCFTNFTNVLKTGWSQESDLEGVMLLDQVSTQLAHLFDAGDSNELHNSGVARLDLTKIQNWIDHPNWSAGTQSSFYENVFTHDQVWELLDAMMDAGLFAPNENGAVDILVPEGAAMGVTISVSESASRDNVATWVFLLEQQSPAVNVLRLATLQDHGETKTHDESLLSPEPLQPTQPQPLMSKKGQPAFPVMYLVIGGGLLACLMCLLVYRKRRSLPTTNVGRRRPA